MSPFTKPCSKPKAPTMPVSSSIVNKASIGPCFSSLLSSTAMAAATPMPLSAPSVVPFAFTQSPSIMVSIGSVSNVCFLSLFFCGTISTCACKITGVRFSMPGVAGLRIKILPVLSTRVSKPSDFPKSVISLVMASM